MNRLVLARLGEIALKGLNRGKFERRLMDNLGRRLKEHGHFKVYQSQSRIWIDPKDADADIDAALTMACSIFGIVSASIVYRYPVTEEALLEGASNYMRLYLQDKETATFKVEAKRGLKSFPMRSPEICAHVGGHLLSEFPKLTVDVHNPDCTLYVEIRDEIYIYSEKKLGLKGLPIGMSGKGMLLLSGGIDSPVAGYKMASRGVELEAVYFHTYPYTSDRAKEKVLDLGRILKKYTSRLRVHVVDFTEIQLEINKNSPQDMITITMRRIMMRIAEQLAIKSKCRSLITGESLGQVASQTMEALCTTNTVVDMPIFRPLIGLDKEETIAVAQTIGTFETSILPYEDCCTVFVAKHPKTRPTLKYAMEAERNLDVEALVEQGVQKVELFEL